MILVVYGLAWLWAVVFGFFAQEFALPIMGLSPLDFGEYAWFCLITVIAGIPLAVLNAAARDS